MSAIYDYCHRWVGSYVFRAQSRLPSSQAFATYRDQVEQLNGQEFEFPTADGLQLSGVYFKSPVANESSPLLIFCNGTFFHKEEYLSHKYVDAAKWLDKGVNLVLFNNRGVGTQKNIATRKGLILDGQAILQYVRNTLQFDESRIIIHGHSLGAGPGTEVAKNHSRLRVCCDRTFTSLTQQVQGMFDGCIGKYVGKIAALLLRFFDWEFDVKGNWQEIRGKKWIVHYGRDGIIPRTARLGTSFFEGQQPQIVELSPVADNHLRALTNEEMDKYLEIIRS